MFGSTSHLWTATPRSPCSSGRLWEQASTTRLPTGGRSLGMAKTRRVTSTPAAAAQMTLSSSAVDETTGVAARVALKAEASRPPGKHGPDDGDHSAHESGSLWLGDGAELGAESEDRSGCTGVVGALSLLLAVEHGAGQKLGLPSGMESRPGEGSGRA
jgi:hypothetical protein